MYLIINLYSNAADMPMGGYVDTKKIHFRGWRFKGLYWADTPEEAKTIVDAIRGQAYWDYTEMAMVIPMVTKPKEIPMAGLPKWLGWEKEAASFKIEQVLEWYKD